MAKGRLKAQRWSMLVQGGTDTRYHLNSVRVLPYSSDAAWDLRRRAIQSCPYLGKLHWKPFHQYGILKTASHTIKDCTDRFGWTMNEFQLLKLEKRTIFHGYRIIETSELFTGAIHLDNTVRKHFYRPTDYQPALRKAEVRSKRHFVHFLFSCPEYMLFSIFNGYHRRKWTRRYEWERYEFNYSPPTYEWIVGQVGLFNLGMATGLQEEKHWIQTWPGEGWTLPDFSVRVTLYGERPDHYTWSRDKTFFLMHLSRFFISIGKSIG